MCVCMYILRGNIWNSIFSFLLWNCSESPGKESLSLLLQEEYAWLPELRKKIGKQARQACIQSVAFQLCICPLFSARTLGPQLRSFHPEKNSLFVKQ